MRRVVFVTLAALAGLLCAAAIGYAAYAVSRDSVAVPVTRLQPTPTDLAPAQVERKQPPRVTTTIATRATTATVEDHHGGNGGHSGHGGGGGGDDD
jgi:predicted MFS family arabinose efflux permease